MPKPNLLILSFTDARRDPRVYREAAYLRQAYQVTLAGLADPGLEGVAFIPVERRAEGPLYRGWIAINLLLRSYGPLNRRFELRKPEAAGAFDLVLANDADTLPLAFALAKGAPVVFDAHEYYPREFEQSLRWRIFHQPRLKHLCRAYIPGCAGMTTVAPGIAKEYKAAFGLLPDVVFNAPLPEVLPVNVVDNGDIRLIHHGAAHPDRCIEFMLEMMRFVDARYSLDLMLTGQGAYVDGLKAAAAELPNVRWRPPVAMQEISRAINRYDLGVYIIQPTNFNNLHCLPNKFFEFIQARLGIAVGPSPEMAAIVKAHSLGVVADDFTPQSLAAKLNALTAEDIMRFKANSDIAAGLYNAEASLKVLEKVLEKSLIAIGSV